MQRYNPKEIEPKWQQQWQESKIYQATEDPSKPKNYILDFFPYPSGAAMHVGHVRNYTISDVLARYARQNGQNVLHPMGWDAFGLPAENYAIKTGTPPAQTVATSTAKFKQQLMQMGLGFDWSREINSSDPNYYKWTQWFFKLLFERGLAYQKESLQWWCETDKTVLANEQVEAGRCWRCGNEVTKKPLKQWFFKITDYADRLVKDLDDVDWSDAIKAMQRNWIGRKTGIDITYKIINVESDEEVICFTTRPDTNFGATFVVIAPEHPLVRRIIDRELVPTDSDTQAEAVAEYVHTALAKSDIERQEEGRKKTGVFTGFYVENRLNGAKLPVWISDFVLAGFGTGAVVGVPGHDLRDFEFASTFSIPIKRVVVGSDGETGEITTADQVQEKTGTMINSDFLDGMPILEATAKIKDHMEAKGMGRKVVSYHLRDWLISRQRYWGAPIPIIHCPDHGAVAVPDDQLPVELPPITDYQPSADGRSPLGKVTDWVNTVCPDCGKPAKRETDTMDGFACSSWYFLRFADPHNDQKPFDADKAKFWLPVDTYVGGAEHAVMHLLYARFWTKVMFDAGIIDFKEPFTQLRNHGMILAADGRKISKSLGNVINPDDLIADGYGADSIRVLEMFIAPWNQQASWSTEGLGGAYRFLQRIWTLTQEVLEKTGTETKAEENTAEAAADLYRAIHKTIKKVTQDIEHMGFNTAIAAMMEAVNELYKLRTAVSMGEYGGAWRWAIESLVQLLAPFAPYLTEELWHQLGHADSVHVDHWPAWDEKYLMTDIMHIVVQVNGRVRADLDLPTNASEETVKQAALQHERVQDFVTGEPKKVVYVPGKIINIVA